MEKFKDKYRVPSARWSAWDYSSNAAYFITICTAHREHYFGEVVNGAMAFTALSQAASDCWQDIPAHFPFVVLDEFVVMPNHGHGIILINKPVGTDVETQNFASLQTQQTRNRFGPQSQNLASVVRGYKIGVTKFSRQKEISFGWQERYHDHVIRNDDEHNRIRYYIQQNPSKWNEDTYYASEK